jgi:type III secretory pathway component EscU
MKTIFKSATALLSLALLLSGTAANAQEDKSMRKDMKADKKEMKADKNEMKGGNQRKTTRKKVKAEKKADKADDAKMGTTGTGSTM